MGQGMILHYRWRHLRIAAVMLRNELLNYVDALALALSCWWYNEVRRRKWRTVRFLLGRSPHNGHQKHCKMMNPEVPCSCTKPAATGYLLHPWSKRTPDQVRAAGALVDPS